MPALVYHLPHIPETDKGPESETYKKTLRFRIKRNLPKKYRKHREILPEVFLNKRKNARHKRSESKPFQAMWQDAQGKTHDGDPPKGWIKAQGQSLGEFFMPNPLERVDGKVKTLADIKSVVEGLDGTEEVHGLNFRFNCHKDNMPGHAWYSVLLQDKELFNVGSGMSGIPDRHSGAHYEFLSYTDNDEFAKKTHHRDYPITSKQVRNLVRELEAYRIDKPYTMMGNNCAHFVRRTMKDQLGIKPPYCGVVPTPRGFIRWNSLRNLSVGALRMLRLIK
ncbi:hypothetical protein FUAX_11860 [Fulvitalea axinellae]|uniref:PPPDE domain-containing protein n=1 Tax=Fulvitalea axinellae TaxID=1182444 RepID=A0AAU9CQR0_9BACT|nr:hypothetical protein FUAX_11860 [Fulvitalea axinellae]